MKPTYSFCYPDKTIWIHESKQKLLTLFVVLLLAVLQLNAQCPAGDESCAFITTWDVNTVNRTIQIPVVNSETYNYTVNWGDGTIQTGITGAATHQYDQNGIYTVKISGDFPRISFFSSSYQDNILSIEQWGTIQWTSMARAFSFCPNLISNATDTPDLSNVTSMESMFRGASSFNGDAGMSNWNVSTVTDMKQMFRDASAFNHDISNWNTSNVTSMLEMFWGAETFNQDIGNWNVKKLTSTWNMFTYAYAFDQDLGQWDISSLDDARFMFLDVTLSPENYDSLLMGWSTLSSGESAIPNGLLFSAGDSQYCQAQLVRDALVNDFNWTITDDGQVPDPANCVVFESGFITTWKTTSANEQIRIPADVTNGREYHYSIDWGDGSYQNDRTGVASHNYDQPGTYTVRIVGDFPRMNFQFISHSRRKIQSIEQWGNIQWQTMELAFYWCENLTINAVDAPDLSKVTNMSHMFDIATNLTVTGTINNWDVSKVKDMSDMFFFCEKFNADISNWNVSKVTTMHSMFRGAEKFNQDIGGWNVGKVETMGSMFMDAKGFNQDIGGWNTSKVTSFDWMFINATSFDQDIGDWDISSIGTVTVPFVQSADRMFEGAGLSTENYDKLLIGWSTLSAGETNIPQNIELDAGNSQFCESFTARDMLTGAPYNWDITDGGLTLDCPTFVDGAFVTTWQTTTNNETITIPTTGSGYSYLVDWGDGVIDANITGNAMHTYASAGTYEVRINGNFPRIYFNNSGDKDKIQSIDQWGSTAWTSMEDAFYGCSNLVLNASDAPDLSNVTNMDEMFRATTNFVVNPGGNMNHWDVSNVVSLDNTFRSAKAFNSDITGWDVSNVEVMDGTFWDARAFDQDISVWDVSNVIDMDEMFLNAIAFNQDISGWNVSQVTAMQEMFRGAVKFNQDISGWNVGKVQDMFEMFREAKAFNQDIGSWDVSAVQTMESMFRSASAFDQDLGNWDISALTDASNMLNGSAVSIENYDRLLIGWSTLDAGESQIPSNVTLNADNSQYCLGELSRNVLTSAPLNWTITDAGLDCLVAFESGFITTWKTDNSGSSGDNQIVLDVQGTGLEFAVDWGDGSIETGLTSDVLHTYDTPGTYTVRVVGTFSMIHSESNDADKLLTIEQWGNVHWTELDFGFYHCDNLVLNATDAPDLSEVTNLNRLFANCPLVNADLDHWDVSNVTTMNQMFIGAHTFNGNISNWDVSNVSNLAGMFWGARAFNQDISGWNVSEALTMANMFNNAEAFTIDISGWDVSKVTSMANMFKNADSFDHDLGAWDISAMNSMTDMFLGVTLSTENYDNTLIGWSTDNSGVADDGIDDIPASVVFSGGNSFYCLSGFERLRLTSEYGWTVTDAGLDTGCTDIFEEAFITTWETTTPDETITIPVNTTLTYSYGVDWGDGTVATNYVGSASHTYDSPGTYTVKIVGDFPQIYFSNGGDKEKIRTIEQWGNIQWGSMQAAFRGCVNLTSNATDTPDLSAVTSLASMFRGAASFVGDAAMANWDVSNVEDMGRLFDGVELFNINIGGWDVSNVTNMNFIFFNAYAFNQDIGNWDVSKLSGLFGVFLNATSFNQDLSNWDTNNMTGMQDAFYGASAFNGDISTWDVSQVTAMGNMFRDAASFNQDIGAWDTGNVLSTGDMFRGASSFNQDIGSWDMSNVTNLSRMFQDAINFDQNIGGWDLSKASTVKDVFLGAGLSTENYDQLLIGWATLTEGETRIPNGVDFNAGSSTYCFGAGARQQLIDTRNWTFIDNGLDCSNNTMAPFITTWLIAADDLSATIPIFNGELYGYQIDWGDGTIEIRTGDATHNYGTPGTYTIQITGYFPRIYFNNSGDRQKIQSIEQWGDIAWSSMESAFRGCSNLVLNATDAPDLSSVSDMSHMFQSATNFVVNGNMNHWDVSNVTNMLELFRQASNFNGDISSWNVSNVTTMNSTFHQAFAFNQNIGTWNVSNVIIMDRMFYRAFAFDQDISNWNVGQVESTFRMFHDAESFNQDIGSWDMSSAKNTRQMFLQAEAFNQDISAWNVSNVTNMQRMFDAAISFDQDISTWDVSSVTDMERMFDGATAFDQDLGTWDIGQVTTMVDMFNNATLSLENYDNTLIGWHTDSNGMTGDGIDDVPSNITFAGGNSVYCSSETERQNLIDTFGWTITDAGKSAACNAISLDLKVFLQGAALNPNTGEEGLMRDDLRLGSHIPLVSPYADALESGALVIYEFEGNSAKVDWLWIELRDATDPSNVIAGRSALLQRDGQVVGVNGSSPITFSILAGNYYVAIQHRNHLGIMTEEPLTLGANTNAVDFTDGSVKTFGDNAQTTFGMPPGVAAMWAGDANDDGKITFLNTGAESVDVKQLVLDRSTVESPFGASIFYKPNGYYKEDLNMDGEVIFLNASNELLYVKDNILAHPSNQLFNSVFFTISAQLP